MIKIFLEEVLGSLTWEAFAREGRSTSSSCGVAHPYFTFYEGGWIVIVCTFLTPPAGVLFRLPSMHPVLSKYGQLVEKTSFDSMPL